MRIVLEPHFLHQEQVGNLLGPERTASALARISAEPSLPSAQPYALAAELAGILSELGIKELSERVLHGLVAVGDLVGVQQAFYFRRNKDADGYRSIRFHAVLNTDRGITVSGEMNAERLTTTSAGHTLAGRSPVYVIGTITACDASNIILRPMFVGIRSYVEDELAFSRYGSQQERRVYPSQIDQFARANFRTAPSSSDVRLLGVMSEADVKASFAKIVGESVVQKDWGGEEADLYSSQLFVDGRQVSSAWLFKGPGFKGKMTIRALGKNGDQIDRLYNQPAEVLVVQHHDYIRAEVIRMMENYAFDARRPRPFMVLDGFNTATILRAYGHLT